MSVKIEVEQLGESDFQVRVIEGATQSSHHVTLKPKRYSQLTGEKIGPAELVRRSFEFLLEREPKESILSRFDLDDISRYFPQFEREITRPSPR